MQNKSYVFQIIFVDNIIFTQFIERLCPNYEPKNNHPQSLNIESLNPSPANIEKNMTHTKKSKTGKIP